MNCVLLVNVFNPAALKMADEVGKFLEKHNHQSRIHEFSRGDMPFVDDDYDLVISLGGDGTVLYAARHCAPKNKPIFPINLGKFGFIAGIQADSWKELFLEFINGKLPVAKRTLLQACVYKNNECVFQNLAFNDVVITSRGSAKQIGLDVVANSVAFGKFTADGIIVASATGSTGYSVAAGGPIVDPAVDVLLFNTVSPFSLSNRPLVLPPDTTLQFTILPSRNAECIVSFDTHVHYDIDIGDVVEVKRAPYIVQLAGCTPELFYAALRSKLHWSGGPDDRRH